MNGLILTLTFISIALLAQARFPVICNRCVGLGQPCGASSNGNECNYPTVCRTLPGITGEVCILPAEPFEACDRDINNCPSHYACSLNSTCEVSSPWGHVGDTCQDSDQCLSGLECKSEKCEIEGDECTADHHCGAFEYCKSDIAGTNTCESLSAPNADCGGIGDARCHTLTGSCFGTLGEKKCVAHFSKDEGAKCDDSIQCKHGLECALNDADIPELVCKEPEYVLIGNYGVHWVGCETIGWRGCQCNKASGFYEMLIEQSAYVFHPGCAPLIENLKVCIEDNNCGSLSLVGESCARTFCKGQILAAEQCPSLNPALAKVLHCSANTMFLAISAIVAVVLMM